jgi:hypothetical protein
MEEEFAVRTQREGTARVTPDIEDVLSTMGGQSFRDRYCGTVSAVVEKEGGVITKQRLRWGEENDVNFNAVHQKSAEILLAAATKAVESGGDPSELLVRFVVKK